MFHVLYAQGMDVRVSDLRAHLSEWLDRVRAGQELVVTERGVPVARLVRVESASVLEQLVAEGVVAAPRQPHRPTASGRSRPRPSRPLAEHVSEQRR